MSRRVNKWETTRNKKPNSNYRGYTLNKGTFIYITDEFWRVKLYQHLGLVKKITMGYKNKRRIYRMELKRLITRDDISYNALSKPYNLLLDELNIIRDRIEYAWINSDTNESYEHFQKRIAKKLLNHPQIVHLRCLLEFLISNAKISINFLDLHYGNFGFLGNKIIPFDVIEFKWSK